MSPTRKREKSKLSKPNEWIVGIVGISSEQGHINILLPSVEKSKLSKPNEGIR